MNLNIKLRRIDMFISTDLLAIGTSLGIASSHAHNCAGQLPTLSTAPIQLANRINEILCWESKLRIHKEYLPFSAVPLSYLEGIKLSISYRVTALCINPWWLDRRRKSTPALRSLLEAASGGGEGIWTICNVMNR